MTSLIQSPRNWN